MLRSVFNKTLKSSLPRTLCYDSVNATIFIGHANHLWNVKRVPLTYSSMILYCILYLGREGGGFKQQMGSQGRQKLGWWGSKVLYK